MYKIIRFVLYAMRLEKDELRLLAMDLRKLGVITIGAASASILLQYNLLAFVLFFFGYNIWLIGVHIRRAYNRSYRTD